MARPNERPPVSTLHPERVKRGSLTEPLIPDIEDLTRVQLYNKAKEMGIRKISRYTKGELIEALLNL